MPAKNKSIRRYGIGSLYVKSGYWCISFSPKHAEIIGLKSRYVATNQAATPTGRATAERMRRKLSDDYYRAKGLLYMEAPLPAPAPQPQEPTLREYFTRFKEEQAGKIKKRTLDSYELSFRVIFGSIGDSQAWRNEWGEALRKYALRRDVHATTQNIYIRGVSVFIHWLEGEMILPGGVMEFQRMRKHALKKTPKEIRVYSNHEVQKLLDECARHKHDSEKHLKLSFIIRLLMAVALRIHEVFEMKREDWNFDTRQLRILHKHGLRYEYVPITEELEAIYKVIEEKFPTQPDAPMFGYSNPFSGINAYRYLFVLVAKEAGVKLDGRSFHEFKKTYITNLIMKKGSKLSLFEIARLSRCATAVIEKHYLLLGNDKMLQVLESE